MKLKKDLLESKLGNLLWGPNNLSPINDVRVKLSRSVDGTIDVRRRDLREFVNDELGGLACGGTLKLELYNSFIDRGALDEGLVGTYFRLKTRKKDLLHVVKMDLKTSEAYDRVLIHELGHGQQMEINDDGLSVSQVVWGALTDSMRGSPSRIVNRCGDLIDKVFDLPYRIADRVDISNERLVQLCELEINLYERLENLYLRHPIERYPENLANRYVGQTNFIRKRD